MTTPKTVEEAGAMTPQEVLLKAADYLEANGWRQGGLGSAGAPCCAVGAIIAVTGDSFEEESGWLKPEGAAAEALLRRFVRDFVPSWNDMAGRTKEEVVRALREAARTQTTGGVK